MVNFRNESRLFYIVNTMANDLATQGAIPLVLNYFFLILAFNV